MQVGPSTVDAVSILEAATGIFALVLFSLSVYAWYLRRQRAIILVATAFFLFFLKTVIDFLPPISIDTDFLKVFLDFAVLALFFLAIVLKPRRVFNGNSSADQNQ